MAYIYPAPGVASAETVLTISQASNGSDTGMVVPALQDMTVNAANDVFTWTQLDETAKLQIATTSTNSISMNLVLDQTTFFGTGDGADAGSDINTAAEHGLFGLSKDKVKINFSLYLGDTDAGATGKTISGSGYITGLAPTVSADSPVWVSPITITVTGEYTVA
jgi:hypothetical protein